ncbi:MAG: folylpolyglutamate synthase/dihydrofolate synthase family protein [Hyphomicrobiales bacterium]|nr:folylpolyglutamate synthase/dihydrofolate synthase family protein [Hyphomicrobiales bacterium]
MTPTASSELLQALERLHPKSIDLSLDRVRRLLSTLGDPQDALPPVIHVAGTNGKGSTVAFIRAGLEAAGYRAHVFISPHLRRFHERIMLAGETGAAPIGEAELVDVLTRAQEANAGAPITFFEVTTAAAFLAFAEHPADAVILETGLGGRLDATNVVRRPQMTVITPISIDHTGFLGSTVSAIAREKAGIIKPGRPCVVSRQPEQALSVIAARGSETGSPIYAAGMAWDAYEQQGRMVYQDETGLVDLPMPRLLGRHQIDNAGTATAALKRLDNFAINNEHIARGLTTAVWPGRLERLGPGALYALTPPGSEIWVDGGHNPAAGEALSRAVADLEDRVPCPLHIIAGMMSTKDAGGFLAHFKGLTEFVATVSIPGQQNGYEASELAAMARKQGLFAEPAASLEDAFAMSRTLARGPTRVLITGSLYLAGQVLEAHEHGLAAL